MKHLAYLYMTDGLYHLWYSIRIVRTSMGGLHSLLLIYQVDNRKQIKTIAKIKYA